MKERLDALLVKEGFFEDKDKAKRAIMAGQVIVNNQKIDKSGTLIKVTDDLDIRIKNDKIKYVSRGGLKLEKAIKEFSLDFKNKTILDIGASTGGFTDCSLQNGADFVFAVDVGTNQLDWKLRNDDRVKSIENTHINDLKIEELNGKIIDYIVMDVSFISVKKILPTLKRFLNKDSKLMILIKPQFEATKENIDKGGIVTDENVHCEVLNDVILFAKDNGFYLENLSFSPITGSKGNVEYISLFRLKEMEINDINIKEIIKNGKNLGGKI